MSIQRRHPATPVRRAGPAVLLALLAAFSPTSTAAQTIDPHALYESRCAACHQPHARDLAQSALALQNGTIVMKSSSAPLRLFLERHPRGLPPAEADALDRHFSAMLQTGFLYEKKCVACHERASTLARLRLFERDGVLEGRYTHRDITTFLRNHGRLTPMEVETIMNMFHRQLAPAATP
jgi:hypothetical protein